ncbi:hypothetical protein SprV_0401585300 [Sparganum proliferum]
MLCLLQGKTLTSLTLLRALTSTSLLTLIIHFLEDVYPFPLMTSNLTFNRFICVIWYSRFFYWVFVVIGGLVLTYFTANRAMQIVCKYQYAFSSSKAVELGTVGVMVFFSALLTLPQMLIVQTDGKQCICSEVPIKVPNIIWTFTEVYLFFAVLFLLNGIILTVSCVQVIRWMYQTQKDNRIDTVNSACFPDTPPELVEKFTRCQGWKSSSMCMVPLTVSYLTCFGYDCIYQFICATGKCTYVINSPAQKFGGLLLIVHAVAVPIIILIFIPALRYRARCLIRGLIKRIRGSRET